MATLLHLMGLDHERLTYLLQRHSKRRFDQLHGHCCQKGVWLKDVRNKHLSLAEFVAFENIFINENLICWRSVLLGADRLG